jgi:hypothetical protein
LNALEPNDARAHSIPSNRAPRTIEYPSNIHRKARGFLAAWGSSPTIIRTDAGVKPGKSDFDFLIHLFYIEGTKMISARDLDPCSVPVDIPTIPGTNDVSPHIPASVHQGPAEQGLPVIAQAVFTDVLQLTTIAIPMDCTSSGKKITDFGYVLLVDDVAVDAILYPSADAQGNPDPNSKTGTLAATVRKQTPRPGLKVTILTKKTVPVAQ